MLPSTFDLAASARAEAMHGWFALPLRRVATTDTAARHRFVSFARARLAACRLARFELSQRWRSEQYMRPARPFVATSQPGKVQRLHTFSFGT